MASITPPIFSSDPTPHKLTYATPKFNTTTTFRLNHPSTYSSTLFSYPLSRVFDSSIICRCQKNNDKSNDENSRIWEVLREISKDAIRLLKDHKAGYRDNFNAKKDDSGGAFVKKEGEVVGDGDGDEDWERWKKHFIEIDEQERIVSILKSQLNRALFEEDYEYAARIKVAIAAAATNDTVGRVMSQLNKSIKEERYKDAAFLRDYAGAGLVGWWAGYSDDIQDPFGRIIHISAEHGRYLARSYSPRLLAKSPDGAPLFEVFITMNEKGEYKHQSVYLKRSKGPGDFPIAYSKPTGRVSVMNSLDAMDDHDHLFADDGGDTDGVEDENDDSDVAEEYGFEDSLDIIPGAKDLKIKVMNVTPAAVEKDTDLLAEALLEIMGEEDDNEDEEEDEIELESIDELEDGTDVEQYDIDFDAGSTIIDDEGNSQIAVKVVVGDLVQRLSNDTSYKDLLRVPAKLERKSLSSFTFRIEKEKKHYSSGNAQSTSNRYARIRGNHSIDTSFDLAKAIGRGKIMKVLKDVKQLISLTLSPDEYHPPLSGSTTFNRIDVSSSGDLFNGLYVGAHGIYTSEVIHLKHKFGRWQEDGSMKESSNLEFYEYVEALKITGDIYVPAGQVAFRAKVGTKYQLPHKGIIPEEFGVIARYRGQGTLADQGFENPRWVDGELFFLDGKYIKGDPVVLFAYWTLESHFLVFYDQLRLQE